MEIFGVGPLELLLVLVLALVILGPEDMVGTARRLGQWVYRVVRSPTWRAILDTTQDLRELPQKIVRDAGLEEAVNEVKQTAAQVKSEMGATTAEINAEMRAATNEMTSEMKVAVNTAQAAAAVAQVSAGESIDAATLPPGETEAPVPFSPGEPAAQQPVWPEQALADFNPQSSEPGETAAEEPQEVSLSQEAAAVPAPLSERGIGDAEAAVLPQITETQILSRGIAPFSTATENETPAAQALPPYAGDEALPAAPKDPYLAGLDAFAQALGGTRTEPEENAALSLPADTALPPFNPSGARSSGGDEALPSFTPSGARSSEGDDSPRERRSGEALPPQTITPEMIAAAPLPQNGDTPEPAPFVESTAPWARGIPTGLEEVGIEVLMQKRMDEMMKALEKLEPHEPPPLAEEAPAETGQGENFEI